MGKIKKYPLCGTCQFREMRRKKRKNDFRTPSNFHNTKLYVLKADYIRKKNKERKSFPPSYPTERRQSPAEAYVDALQEDTNTPTRTTKLGGGISGNLFLICSNSSSSYSGVGENPSPGWGACAVFSRASVRCSIARERRVLSGDSGVCPWATPPHTLEAQPDPLRDYGKGLLTSPPWWGRAITWL